MALVWCIDEKHSDPCPQTEEEPCRGCLDDCDPEMLVYRFVVGENNAPSRIGSYETMEQVVAWQETLDQERLHRGDYYIDDMEESG